MKQTLLATIALLAATPATAALEADAGFGGVVIGACGGDLQRLNQVTGWQTAWPAAWKSVAAGEADLASSIATWRAAPGALRRAIAAMEQSLKDGRAAPKAVAVRVRDQVRALTSDIQHTDGAYAPAGDDRLSREWRRLVRQDIAPALAAYEAFLSERYIPKAPEKSALASLGDNGRCFRAAAAAWTTLDLAPAEIEARGERLLAETRGRFGGDVDARLLALEKAYLETPTGADDIIAVTRRALDRAAEAAPRAFEGFTTGPVAVAPLDPFLEESSPAAFYRPGPKPVVVVNGSRPAERRALAEAIAFHEGTPGHHLFFAAGASAGGFNSGFVEGWAIYAERLADELGLYSSPLDRDGMLAKHLWAASRLIIEPRLHDGRWSRDDAIRYMQATTALPDAEIAIEIDRYLAMPGQSLAYMLGYDVILSARTKAQARLGSAFDLKGFHGAVLSGGMKTLPDVEKAVAAWPPAR